MNDIIRNLTVQNFENLKASFDYSKKIFWDEEKNKLIHPGEFGSYREKIIHDWLRLYVPKKYGIASGFVINSRNKISTQCDLIIYDIHHTPQIQTDENQKFFPIETVLAIGEIKSDINSFTDLKKYAEKLSEIKKMRSEVKNPKPYYKHIPGNFDLDKNPQDNIFTFLICNKFNFDPTGKNYNIDTDKKHRTNLILSLTDGLINYTSTKGAPNLWFPFLDESELIPTFIKNNNKNSPDHVILFLTSLIMAIKFTTLLEIDMTLYLTDEVYDDLIL
ncbi:DUF6602 domain-containing protein [Flavobacterium anhuiense]|uniref:DUF6602 domain-containing protein n=1 Tax=Flavobacterium anhuiense TaxID=459526 RepID=UPI0034D95B3C